MKPNTVIQICLALQMLALGSCKKEFDEPPVKPVESGPRINIAMIKDKFKIGVHYKFRADSNLYCVVTADEVSGNLFREIYVSDVTGALHVRLKSSGGLYIGDSIRVNLKGAILNDNNKLIQLDSVDSEKRIVKLAAGLTPKPVVITMQDALLNTMATSSVQSRLVTIGDVEFIEPDRSRFYADAIGRATLNRTLVSCDGHTLAVRTSGYSNLADKKTPDGHGNITGIMSQFGTTMQLILRSAEESDMKGALCSKTHTNSAKTILFRDFNDDNISGDGWMLVNSAGTISWTTASSMSGLNTTKVAECNNFIGSGNQPACESWLISKAIDLSVASAPSFSFESAVSFSGPGLEVLVSSDYIHGLPATASWTKLAPKFAGGSVFLASGMVSLAEFKKKNVRIAFKYIGNVGSGARWQIDNFRIYDP